ncbi:MAG: methyltransferase domain-containing protein [Thermoleophilaceae bacterium]
MTRGEHSRPASGSTAGAVRYEVTIDPTGNTSHSQILAMVPDGSRVLELGPATGSTTERLRERGCRVTTVEIDPEAAARASAWSERTLVADLDREDLGQLVGDEAFEVIIAADVLEHLKEPARVLRSASSLLTPEGFCVVSLPNIAHGAVRLALLEGRWEYTDVGLLDHTHLRFFTRAGVRELFEAAGYGLEEIRTVDHELADARVDFDRTLLEGPIGDYVTASADAKTFQFVARARPRTRSKPRPTRSRGLADEQSRLIRHLTLRARAADETIREQYTALADQAKRIERHSAKVEKLERRLKAGRRAVEKLERRLKAEERSGKKRKKLQKRHRELQSSRAVRAARLLGGLSRQAPGLAHASRLIRASRGMLRSSRGS